MSPKYLFCASVVETLTPVAPSNAPTCAVGRDPEAAATRIDPSLPK